MKGKKNKVRENISHVCEITKEIEQKKEEKLVNLFTEIIVKKTLKEYYETGDKIP